MYRNKLWPQYQSILYLSTRNKSFIPSVLLSVEPYLCFCGKCHISNLVCLRTRLGVSNTPLSAPFFGTFAPSLSFQPTTLCSPCLWVFVLFLLEGWLLCWMVVSSMVFFYWVSGVLTLGPYCLLHTVVYVPVQYSWCCQVLKVPQYHGVYRTTISTLFHYFIVRTVLMVMSSTGSATVQGTLEASVQQCYYCSTLPSSTVMVHCTVLAVFFYCCHFLAF